MLPGAEKLGDLKLAVVFRRHGGCRFPVLALGGSHLLRHARGRLLGQDLRLRRGMKRLGRPRGLEQGALALFRIVLCARVLSPQGRGAVSHPTHQGQHRSTQGIQHREPGDAGEEPETGEEESKQKNGRPLGTKRGNHILADEQP